MTRPPQRLPDWKPRLISMLNSRRAKPFEVGQTDCTCFAVSVVEALTGVRPFDITHRTAQEGLELIKRHGYERAFGVNHLLGDPSADWRRLQFGDLARLPPNISETWKVETYGVYVGQGRLLVPGEKQLDLHAASLACKIWNV